MKTIKLQPNIKSQANGWNGLLVLSGMEPLPLCLKCGGLPKSKGPSRGQCICDN